MTGQSVWRRLVSYAVPFRKRIMIALVLLLLGTSADLVGPFIAKIAIDSHILSIQKNWYQFEQLPAGEALQSVKVQNHILVREDWVDPQKAIKLGGKPVQIITEKTAYYLLDGPQPDGGAPKILPLAGSGAYRVIFTKPGGAATKMAAVRLNADDVKALYGHDIGPLIYLTVGYGLLILFSAGLNYIQLLSLQTTAQRIIQRLRIDIFSHLQKLPVSYFDKTPTGSLVSRVTNDTEAIRELYVSVLATFVQNTVFLLGILVALYIMQPMLALFCTLLLPVVAVLVLTYRRISTRYYTVIRARLADMNATINEMIQNMGVVQAFRREKDVAKEFAEVNETYYRTKLKEMRLESFMLRPAVDFLWKLSLVIIIWYFGSQSFTDVISFGVLYAFVDYMGRFFEPINMVMDRLSQLQQAVISAKRVFDVMDTPTETEEKRERMERPRGKVVFDNVSFAYNDQDYVLKNVSFTAEPGQTIALVGHTGSGKSSLMNLLLGFYPINKGCIEIDGQNIAEQDPKSLREHIGLVLQDPFLFTGSVGFNIRLYNQGIGDEKLREVAKAVKADAFIEKLAAGYDEQVVEKGATLSAGQRQLISFARALAADPAILILDEATASIDSETEAVIQEALHVLSSGRTTFIIAHRLSTIQHADQILVLSRGEIVERGTHEELMERNGVYNKMYQLQQGQTANKAVV
ncbi:ABC transporter ATP-binding protein [Brevibacillus fluminis]|uniref:ABC transporter ATP-binding protein n=1 Tax=Brevibacillus fluminis TaxID=511487 RepID=A0A3M8DCM7_9BACL|nr:ABC transporter ATP-binding protein [Brevibacillus fluminis]RNB85890.1 ABC transporter ATP-binding protein [Brevibacillus fluminis]